MSILITGGTGFVGSHLARKLVDKGEDKVVLFDVMPFRPAVEDIIDHVEIVQGDFSESTHVMGVLKKYNISCLFHLGHLDTAETEYSPSQTLRINCEGTANLFEMARIAGVKRVVWSSSVAVYGNVLTSSAPELVNEEARPTPKNMYGITKLFNENVAELYAQRYGFDYVCLRLSSVYGLGRATRRGLRAGAGRATSDIYSSLVEGAARGQEVGVPPEQHLICWSYIQDCAQAFYCAYKVTKPKHRIFNFGGENRTVGDAVGYVKSLFPKASVKMAKQAVVTGAYVDTTRIREELRFEPAYTMEKGIKDYVNQLLGSTT